jgi:manganese/iron transport system ATP-binding protein
VSALAVEGLAVDLGGRPVLRDVSLEVRPGELVGLLGPNGAGKTTLLRAVLGLVARRAGRVLVEGGPVRRGRAALGYVPQRHEFTWDFPLSVERAVLTGRAGLGGRAARAGFVRRGRMADWRAVGDALERVGLTDLRARPLGELSGGQRQRVLVARALAVDPRVLLLDEPCTGLDVPTQESLHALFVELAAEDRAVLMTTHDLLAARTTCSRLVLLNGTVVADGPPGELRAEELWMRTFAVSADSTLLKLLQVA